MEWIVDLAELAGIAYLMYRLRPQTPAFARTPRRDSVPVTPAAPVRHMPNCVIVDYRYGDGQCLAVHQNPACSKYRANAGPWTDHDGRDHPVFVTDRTHVIES